MLKAKRGRAVSGTYNAPRDEAKCGAYEGAKLPQHEPTIAVLIVAVGPLPDTTVKLAGFAMAYPHCQQ